MASTTFRGVIETAFENFVCLRGFATLGELVDVSVADESYQRPLIDGRAAELGEYLERGEYKFFPEVVLSCNLDNTDALVQLQQFLAETSSKGIPRTSFGHMSLALSARSYKSTKDQRVRGHIVDASFTLNESASKLLRIDGNHRLSAAMSESVRRYRVPFCMVLFGNQDQASGFGRAVFHTINFKQRPMDMEHNLRLILDETEENLRLFPTDKLRSEPSFGRPYVRSRLLLPKIDLDHFEAIHNALVSKVGDVKTECRRTFALAVAQLFDADDLEDAVWVRKVFAALKHVNGIYAQHGSLKASGNRGVLAAFVFLSMESDAAARSKLKRFTDWIVRGHLATMTEIAPADLLEIFDKLQTAKNRQVFVAMAFRDETKPTFKAIQDAIDDVNRDHHLGLLPIKPIRIDEFDTWRSYKITDAIMEQIEGCGLVIADLTYGNANVYHEVGYLFGLNTTQQRRLVDNLILIWHKNRLALDHEKAGTQEAVDVRFDLKDWSALRFSEPNELRKSLAAALVEHYSPLNT
jgi:hypothetical protein